MTINFIDELRWRGQLHDITPGTEEQLSKEMTSAYIGFDPTADSLHVGSLAQIILLRRFQQAGHRPVALVGGATGMVGDPSGKSAERNLLSDDLLQHNLQCLQQQLAKFLDFDSTAPNAALMVNNADWFAPMNVLDFLRDVGKHITVSYMLSKDSVKNRMEREEGISYTEFSYQLIQGYDFQHLYSHYACKLQMGGSDQWGNIVTGTELVRRMSADHSGKAYALTIHLVNRADGTKFGKTVTGDNIWLDANKTSPYKFYQFWLNQSDADAAKYVRYFTFDTQQQISELEQRHAEAPHLRLLQHHLAQQLTTLVHSAADLQQAIETSDLLFKGSPEALQQLPKSVFLEAMDGVPTCPLSRQAFDQHPATGIDMLTLLSQLTAIYPSKTEARKALQAGAVLLNKQKISDPNASLTPNELLHGQYLLVQKGKKNYYLVVVGDGGEV